jgi:hypothetical protein
MKKPKTHEHRYVPHPNPKWSTHYACTICGLAIPKWLIDKMHPELVVKEGENNG